MFARESYHGDKLHYPAEAEVDKCIESVKDDIRHWDNDFGLRVN